MKEIIFEIPVVTPMLNTYVRWHWTTQRKHTEEMALLVRHAIGPSRVEPVMRCVLIIERHSAGGSRKDWDGLLGGMKGLLDAMTSTHKHGVGLIYDDDTKCILSTPTILDVRCKRGEQKTRVRIIPMEE